MGILDAPGLSKAVADGRYPPTTGPIKADMSALGVYLPEAHGAKGDGTTDDTAAVNAAIAAAQTNGGKVWLQNKTYLCLGAITPVYSGPSTAPVQKPVRITSNGGAGSNGYWAVGPTNGGPILDLRYDGTDGLHPAKIDTRGAGSLEIDHIVLRSGGTDDYPFLRTSNTTCFLHHNMVVGNAAHIRAAAVQDVFVFGGTSNVTIGDGPDAPFQGYGGKVHDNYFAKIRRGFLGQNYCNSISVENNTFSTTCGSSTGGAIEFHGSAIAGYTVGNLTRGNTIECTNYKYAIAAYWAANCTFGPDGYWDGANNYTAGVFIDPSANFNTVIGGYFTASQPLCLDPGNTTDVITSAQSVASIHNQPEIFNNAMLGVAAGGLIVVSMELTGNQAGIQVDPGNFPYPEAQMGSAPCIYVTDAVTTSGSAVITSATAAWTAQDLGMPIYGPGVAAYTRIMSRQSATQVTLSAPATVTGTGVTLRFGRIASPYTTEIGFARRHIQSKGNVPAGGTYPPAGAGSTLSLAGTDTAWTLTLTTGTGTAAGRQIYVAAAINWAIAPKLSLTPKNAAAAGQSGNVYLTNTNANTFLQAIAALPVSTVFVWDVMAIG